MGSIGGSTGISRGFNGLQNGSTPPQDGTGSQDGARSQDDPAPHLDGVPPTDPKKAQSCWSCCGCWNWFRSSGPSIQDRCVAWITYPWSKVKELCTCCNRRTTPTPPESQEGDDDKQLDSAQQRADLIAGRSFGLYVPQVMPDTNPGDWEKLGCFGKAVVTFMLVTFCAVCIANCYMSCPCLFCCC